MEINKYIVIDVITNPEELRKIADKMEKELQIPHIKRLGKTTVVHSIHMTGVSLQFSYTQN